MDSKWRWLIAAAFVSALAVIAFHLVNLSSINEAYIYTAAFISIVFAVKLIVIFAPRIAGFRVSARSYLYVISLAILAGSLLGVVLYFLG